MAFYAVDVRDRVIQRVTQEYNGVDNKRFFLIEARSAKQAWAKADIASEPDGSAVVCSSCRHRHCRVCEEWSVTKAYSDYWICHCCGALTERVPSLHLREVSNGLGEN
jgi:hypothetical protein